MRVGISVAPGRPRECMWIFISSMNKVYITCSGWGKGFLPETLCVGVEEDVVCFVEG